MKNLFARLRVEEDGSSLTEFVMFLPIFIVVFAGIVNLGKLGYSTTQTQVMAQRDLWAKVIPVTHSISDAGDHVTSAGGGGIAAAHLGGLAGDSNNPQQLADGYEAIVMLGLAAGGHWGESYLRTAIAEPFADNLERTEDPDDILNERKFPTSILNDGVANVMPSGGVIGIVLEYISGSGVVAALAAGIRYGEVFGEKSESYTLGRAGNFTSSAHYDVLVAPSPLKGFATKTSWAVARAYAEGQDEYRVMMNFGESEWEGDSSGNPSSNPFGDLGDFDPDFDPESEEYQSEIEEAEREAQEAADEQAGGG